VKKYMWKLLEKTYENKRTLIIFRTWEMITCTTIIIGVIANIINIIHKW